MSPLPDADEGDRILDGYALAQKFMADDNEPDPVLVQVTDNWCDAEGIDAGFRRELTDEGPRWYFVLLSARGTARHRPEPGQTWRDLLAELELLPPGAPRPIPPHIP